MQALSSAGDFVVPPRRAEIHPRMELQRNKTDKNSVGLLAQLALDYSPEEDAGLTLASLPTSFLGRLRKPNPLLGHPQQRFLVERANRLGCLLTALLGFGCGTCVHRLLAGRSVIPQGVRKNSKKSCRQYT